MALSRPELLLSRLNAIGASLTRSNKALALIGLGSVGLEVDRLDRLLELAETIEPAAPASRDPFARERRYEQRHPRIAQALPSFGQGSERSVESVRAILAFSKRTSP